jgi:hypothetical protein
MDRTGVAIRPGARPLCAFSIGNVNVLANGIDDPLQTPVAPKNMPGQKGPRKSPELVHAFAPFSAMPYPGYKLTDFAQLSDRVIEMFSRKFWEGLARADNIRGVRLLACFQKLRKFIRHIFDFRMPNSFSRAQHNNDNDTIFSVAPMGVRKDAIHMLGRNAGQKKLVADLAWNTASGERFARPSD